MESNNIDLAVDELRAATDRAEREGRRFGYFSALYARMTAAMAQGIRAGYFEDGSRMERLAVAFARLYLDALANRLSGRGDVPASWCLAFDAWESDEPCLLQHIYLGMNAHLFLDLPIAEVATCPGEQLASLRADHLRINGVVRSQLGGFHRDLCAASPRLEALQLRAGGLWAFGSNCVLGMSRRLAWRKAETLARTPSAEHRRAIEGLDRNAAALGAHIARPGLLLGTMFRALRRGEREDVPQVIRVLRGRVR